MGTRPAWPEEGSGLKVEAAPPWPLALPEWAAKLAQPWDPNLAYAKELVIEAEGYQKWVDEILPIQAGLAPQVGRYWEEGEGRIEVGRWQLTRRLMRQFVYRPLHSWGTTLRWQVNGLTMYRQGTEYGRVHFAGDVYIPVLADSLGEPWMSITPNEVLSCRPGVRAARGRVLVGGLGLGMMARMIREKKTVNSVTVVDNNEDVLRVFGAIPGVELVHGDLFGHARAHLGDYDSIVADIWQGYNDAPYDDDFQRLKREHPRVWGWGDYAVWRNR